MEIQMSPSSSSPNFLHITMASSSLANLCQGLSLLEILLNHTILGIALIDDASSSQSRADLLTLGLAVTNILAVLIWFSIRPKSLVWESLFEVTCSRSLVIVYDTSCILQIGFVAESSNTDEKAFSVDTDKLMKGLVCQGVMKSGTQLFGESLYPRRSELPFLPSNTQLLHILLPFIEFVFWLMIIYRKLDKCIFSPFSSYILLKV
ncbi:hypothetical protein UlMin_027033 [Ulmus minor]